MVGIGSELQTKAGPLPVWAWAGLGIVGVSGILIYRKKQSMNAANQSTPDTSTSVIGGPSTLIPTASPMPYSQGDTFVDTTINNLPPGGSSTSGEKGPPGPPGKTGLPAVNAAASPAKINKNSPEGRTMIKVGCIDTKGHYSGKQVSGGVPVYGLSTLWGVFAQGALAQQKGHCLYIPEKFKAYIVG